MKAVVRIGQVPMEKLPVVMATLRRQSTIEVEIVGDKSLEIVERALKRCMYSWAGSVNGRIACVWGLYTKNITDNEAYLWLLTTKVVDEYPFLFVRYSKLFIDTLQYKVIYGHVDKDYARSIKWLKWLGFTIGTPIDQVCHFEMRKG